MSVALVAAFAAGYMMTSSNESEVNVNDLTQANVEALADDLNYIDCVDFGWHCTDGYITFESKNSVEIDQ